MNSFDDLRSYSKFGFFINKAIVFVLAMFTAYFIYLNLIFTLKNNVIIYLIVVVPIIAVVFVVSYYLDISYIVFAITIFILALITKGVFVSIVDTQPFSDFSTFYNYAIRLLNGDKSFGSTVYFTTWAYQTGPIIYYSAIMKLFGTSILPLKLVNCIFMAGTNMFIYLIARKISNDFTARFVALLYLLYPAPFFLAPVLTNQHFAACMFIGGIYFFVAAPLPMWAKGLLAGVLMSLGNAVRPLGIVIVGAIIIWGIAELIYKKRLIAISPVIILVITYLVLNWGISGMVKQAGINPEGLSNNYPLWKFVIGFNHDSNGQFSYDDQNKLFYIKDLEKRDEASKTVIKERLSVPPSKLARLINNKFKIMWADFDTLRWGFYHKQGNKLLPSKRIERIEPLILRTEKIYYLCVFILMLMGLIRMLSSKKLNNIAILLSTIVLCYFGTHVLVEIQVRYRYFCVILIFILAAKGSEVLFCTLSNYKKEIRLDSL